MVIFLDLIVGISGDVQGVVVRDAAFIDVFVHESSIGVQGRLLGWACVCCAARDRPSCCLAVSLLGC